MTKTIKKMILYGTNDKAQILLNRFDFAYVVDSDPELWGQTFCLKEVHDPQYLLTEDVSQILVVLAFRPSGEAQRIVTKQLCKMGFLEGVHFVSMYDILPKDLPYEEIRPSADYAPWKADEDFLCTYDIVRGHTLLDKYRAYGLWSLVEQVRNLSGALMEVGVWRGGGGAIIARKSKRCGIADPVYLCDTFSGVTKADPVDDSFYQGGEHADTNEEIVQDLIVGQLELDNVQVIKGIFPDETEELILDRHFRFCHIDVDTARSARDIFEWIWPRVVVGGVVVFDDYGFMCCDGITRYVNQLKERDDLVFVYTHSQGIIVKTKTSA